ncbi:FadR family transcriptional regulator [Pantoea sp. Ap-967]|nr:FadR family transcriptional regulator [Pantoea sp. Ap-967]
MDAPSKQVGKSRPSDIVQTLGLQIIGGHFKEGEKLPHESELMETLGVSRTVLRESFKVLTAKGLVYSRPGLGTVVKARENWHVMDPEVLCWLVECTPQSQFFEALTTVRRIFEPAMAALAASRAEAADIAVIKDAYERMEKAKDRTEFLVPDLDFHRAIAKATHNFFLVHLSDMLSVALRESIELTVQRPNVSSHSLPRHKAILTAIESRDPAAARQASLLQLDDTEEAKELVSNKLTTL